MKSLIRLLSGTVLFSLSLFAQENPSSGHDPLVAPGDTAKVSVDSTRYLPRDIKDSVIIDTLAPLYQLPMLGATWEFSQDDLKLMNFRNGATLLQHFPVAYNRSMGFLGQPSEMVFYGEGNGKISFLEDGIEINNGTTGSFYFDYLQEGYIDKISLYPSYMGFVYAATPKQITLGVTGRDFISGAPYSKIKYFEGPAGEGYIDVHYNQTLSNRFTLFTEVANNKVNDGFRNSDLSLWRGKVKLKYIISNKINLLAGYDYIQHDVGLNGGVDYDSAKVLAAGVPGKTADDFLYDDRAAPVKYLNRYQKSTQNRLHFKAFGSLGTSSYFEGSVYHLTELSEFRQNETVPGNSPDKIMTNNRYSITGASFRSAFATKHFDADLNANYSSLTVTNSWFANDEWTEELFPQKKTSFSVGGTITGKLAGFELSGFGKFFIYNKNHYSGIGGEAKAAITDEINFRAGVGYIESLNIERSIFGGETKSTKFEAEFTVKSGPVYVSLLGWASNDEFNQLNSIIIPFDLEILLGSYVSFLTNPVEMPQKFYYGVVGNVAYSIGNFTGFVNAQYNRRKLEGSGKDMIPAINGKAGVTYASILFNEALNLRTTLSFSFRSSSVAIAYNFISDRVLYEPWKEDVPASGQLDFFLAGTIQKVATVFVAFENLLGAKYYLVPYYPVLPRNFRFGINWEFLN